MMMQSVPTQSMGILQAVGSAKAPSKSGESKFELFLGSNSKTEAKIPARAKAISGDKHRQATQGEDKIKTTTRDKIDIESANNRISNQTINNQSEKDKTPLDQIDPNLAGQIQAMLNNIRSEIMDKLELDSEELDSMMMDLGIKLEDLTDPQAIMQLILSNSGVADPLAVAFDEQLSNTFQALISTVNDIKSEANLQLTSDEIKMILEQFDNDNNEALIGNYDPGELHLVGNAKKPDSQTGADKEKNINIQISSNDEDIKDQSHMTVTQDNGDSSETKNPKDGSDKTDEFVAFLDKLDANYEKPIAAFDGNSVRFHEIREIAQQIINHIRVVIKPGQTTMELQLNPEHLGKVNLTVSSQDGIMTAHFLVQNELAKEAVEGQLVILKETLEQQGIKVDSIEVMVGDYTFDQNSSSKEDNQMMDKKQRTGNKITLEEAVAMGEEPLEEGDTMKANGIDGYTIDYTA